MGLWDTIKRWSEQNAQRYVYAYIPAAKTDVTFDDAPLVPDRSYYRLWLSEMYLANSREWFTNWYPAVQASVNLRFGDTAPVTFSRIVRAPNDALARGVLMNYPLTDLLPYRGGIVEIEGALLAFKGQSGTDYISAALGLLENFGGLVAAPLGQAVQVAQAVNKGIDDLISAADGRVHLSLHQAFVSGNAPNALKAGFVAVILVAENQLNTDALTVRENRLYYQGQPLSGYDYFLLQIERREERDDWQLSYIDELMDKIANAIAFGKTDEAQTFKQALKFAVYNSNDFTFADKVRVLKAIKERMDILSTSLDSEVAPLSPETAAPPLNELIRRDSNFFGEVRITENQPLTEEDLLKMF